MDKKRLLVFSTLLILLISPVAAEVGPSVDDVGGLLQSAGDATISFLNSYTNMDIEDQPALTFFSALGLLYLSTFVALDRTLEYAGMKDMFVTGQGHGEDESKLRLILLSILFFGVFLGSGAFTPVVVILSQSILLTFILGVAAVIVYGAVGGYGVLKGGAWGAIGTSRKAVASGRNKFANDTEALADAEQRTEEAGEYLEQTRSEEQDAEQRAENGDTETADDEARDAQKKVEKALNDIEAATSDIETILDKHPAEFRQMLNDARDAYEDSGKGIKSIRDFDKRAVAIVETLEDMNTILGGRPSSWADYKDYGISVNHAADVTGALNFIEDELNHLKRDIAYFESEEKNQGSAVKSEFQDLRDIVKMFTELEELHDTLPKEIETAMEEENFAESLSEQLGDKSLRREVGKTESEIEALGEKIKQLNNNIEDISDTALRECQEFVGKELEYANDVEEKLIEVQETYIPQMEREIENLKQGIRAEYSGTGPGSFVDRLNNILGELSTLESRIEVLLRREQEIETWLDKIGNYI